MRRVFVLKIVIISHFSYCLYAMNTQLEVQKYITILNEKKYKINKNIKYTVGKLLLSSMAFGFTLVDLIHGNYYGIVCGLNMLYQIVQYKNNKLIEMLKICDNETSCVSRDQNYFNLKINYGEFKHLVKVAELPENHTLSIRLRCKEKEYINLFNRLYKGLPDCPALPAEIVEMIFDKSCFTCERNIFKVSLLDMYEIAKKISFVKKPTEDEVIISKSGLKNKIYNFFCNDTVTIKDQKTKETLVRLHKLITLK